MNDRDRMKGTAAGQTDLGPLDEFDDLEVSDEDPDVRGWAVRAADDQRVGKVKELVVDRGAMRVRYLDVQLDRELAREDDRRVLVPIGAARLDESENEVRLPITSHEVQETPAWFGSTITREQETLVCGHYMPTNAQARSTQSSSDDFYQRDYFDENRFFGDRRSGRGDSSYLRRAP